MGTDSFATRLLNLEPRQFVTLSGYPESGDTSRWHVNKATQISGGTQINHAIVLQASDGDKNWIIATVVESRSGVEIDKLAAFEGEPPAGMEPDEHAEDLDPADLDIVSIDDD